MSRKNYRLLIDRKTSAKVLGISLRSLDLLLSRGVLRGIRIGRRRLIPRWELEEFVRR